MNRKSKNIIAIVIILLLCGSIVFTSYLSSKSSNSSNMSNMNPIGSEPPEMPSGDKEEKPPEKPEGGEEPPEKPSGDNNMGNPPEMPGDNGGMEIKGQQENNIDYNYIYLILFGIESLTLSLILLYLILSGFNL